MKMRLSKSLIKRLSLKTQIAKLTLTLVNFLNSTVTDASLLKYLLMRH